MTNVEKELLEFAYPFRAARQPEGGYTITFRDLPEVVTQAEDGESLDEVASDCLSEALAGRLSDREKIPRPSAPRRGERVTLPETKIELKIAFHHAFMMAGLTQVDLAARMGVTPLLIRRLLDPEHNSHVQQYDEAMQALGLRMFPTIEIRAVA